jgi:hypothetical protein
MGNIQFNLLAIPTEMFACACHILWDSCSVMGNVLIIPVLVLDMLQSLKRENLQLKIVVSV